MTGGTIMATKGLILAGCAMALLMLAGCGRKEPPTVADSAPAAEGAAGPAAQAAAPIDGPATLEAPTAAGAGAVIEVKWTGPGNTGDYIDLVPRGNTVTSGEITYAYTRDAKPVARLTMPTTPGEYDLRYMLEMGSARTIKATAPIVVTAVAATLAGPPAAEGAEPIEVAWTGPSGSADYIDIVPSSVIEPYGEVTYAWAREGSPARLTTPGKVGDYLVRYIQEGPGGRKILATSPLRATQPKATIDGPDSAEAGKPFAVTWTGPKRKGDYIDLVKQGQAETSGELSYFYTEGAAAGELKAPAAAGQYDIRYLLEAPGGRVVLAKRTIRVR